VTGLRQGVSPRGKNEGIAQTDGTLGFHPLDKLGDGDVAEVLARTRERVLHVLRRQGVLDEDESNFQLDALGEDSPSLAVIYSASVL